MSVLSLTTIANNCFSVPGDGGPTVRTNGFGGPALDLGLGTKPAIISNDGPGGMG